MASAVPVQAVFVVLVVDIAVLLLVAGLSYRRERNRPAEPDAARRVLDGLLSNPFAGMAVVDRGVVVEANDAFGVLLGCSAGDLVGRRLRHLLAERSGDALGDLVAVASGEIVHLGVTRRDGTAFAAEAVAVPVGEERRVLSVLDVTALGDAGRSDAGRSDAGRTRGRSTADGPPLDGDVSVQRFIEEQRSVWQLLAGRTIEVDVAGSSGGGSVAVDRSRLHQILLNLVLNAVAAMPDGGVLRIATFGAEFTEPNDRFDTRLPAGSYQIITVADSGTGIAADRVAHVFDPPAVPDATARSGLGLWATAETVRHAGGALGIVSGPGGTIVSVVLPAWSRSRPGAGFDRRWAASVRSVR